MYLDTVIIVLSDSVSPTGSWVCAHCYFRGAAMALYRPTGEWQSLVLQVRSCWRLLLAAGLLLQGEAAHLHIAGGLFSAHVSRGTCPLASSSCFSVSRSSGTLGSALIRGELSMQHVYHTFWFIIYTLFITHYKPHWCDSLSFIESILFCVFQDHNSRAKTGTSGHDYSKEVFDLGLLWSL